MWGVNFLWFRKKKKASQYIYIDYKIRLCFEIFLLMREVF